MTDVKISGTLTGRNEIDSRMSWSSTTDISSRLRFGSGMNGFVDHGIQIGTEPAGVDSRCSCRRIGNDRSWHKPARPDRSEFCNRYSMVSHDDDLPGLDFAEHSASVVAKLSLRDGSIHGGGVWRG
jgi:hypothetical protein